MLHDKNHNVGNPEYEQWLHDFREFIDLEGQDPSDLGCRHVLTHRLQRDLYPSLLSILLKISALHFLAGTLTLFFCPQFGVSLGQSHHLFHVFMRWGHTVCMVACGVTFIGGTALLASWLLSVDEVRTIRQQPVWPWVVMSAISLAIFHMIGRDAFSLYALIWLAASGLGGSGLLELGWYLRRRGTLDAI